MKKEKVVAVRLTQSQLEALEWCRSMMHVDEPYTKTMSQFVAHLLKHHIDIASEQRAAYFKREEAAAKRKATREAKKAASDDAK